MYEIKNEQTFYNKYYENIFLNLKLIILTILTSAPRTFFNEHWRKLLILNYSKANVLINENDICEFYNKFEKCFNFKILSKCSTKN